MMQRWCSRLRPLATQTLISPSSSRPLLRSSPHLHQPLHFTSITKWSFRSLLSNAFSPNHHPSLPTLDAFRSSSLPLSLYQVRYVSSKERKKRRKPMTPVTSKLKKIKMKSYSSYKSRFKTLNDGTIRRWREGKRHNAHLKSKKSKRRLRQPALVPAAYAKVMKKLNFCG